MTVDCVEYLHGYVRTAYDRAKLKGQLQLLLKRQPEVFGASSHEYRLNEPPSDSELGSFEPQHGVTLPEDYRWFLSQMGNGGAGPYYGVFLLGEMDDGHEMKAWQEDDGFVGRLRNPFPHINA